MIDRSGSQPASSPVGRGRHDLPARAPGLASVGPADAPSTGPGDPGGGPALPSPLPLVGRDTELRRIRESLSGETGTSVLVLVGDGGVGKSRLVREVALGAEEDGWSVVRGRAYPVERGVPYALFADAFIPFLKGMEPERLTVLSRGGEADLTALFPALGRGALDPTSGDPAELRTRLHWSFTQLLRRYAERAPLLVVLEDLQWADASSIELLHFVARQLAGTRVRLICTWNDAEKEPGSSLARAERSLRSLGVGATLRLEPLTREEVSALLQRTFSVSADVVGAFSALLYGWTRGNVFFVEEILKSMLASGRLRRLESAWTGWDTSEVELPGSIREAVLARVSMLSEDAQRVAELASVVGARARHPVLSELAGLDEVHLLDALEELLHHRILAEREESGVVVYVFEHPLVRQTLYEELGLQRARMLHGKVAEALESYHGDAAEEHADELAYHYSRTDAPKLRDKASGYLVVAGRKALERRADREAVEYFETARSLMDGGRDHPAMTELLQMQARALQHVGSYREAVKTWTEALDLSSGDAERQCGIRRSLGLAHFWRGDHAEAHRQLDRGLALAEETGAAREAVRLRIAKGHCLHEVGRGEEALATLSPALPLAEELGDVGLQARVHRALTLLYVWIGPPEKAHGHGGRAVALAREAGDVSVEFWARWGLGVLLGMRGGSERMGEAVDELTALADRARAPVLRLWTAEMEIELAYGRGDWDQGVALGERAIALARDLRQRYLLPRLMVWTSQFYLGRGQADRAKQLVDEAVRTSGMQEESGPVDVHLVVPATIGLAHYRIGVGEYEGAIDAAEHGLRIAEGTGYTLWAVHRLLPVLAEACLWAGAIDRAEEVGRRLRKHAQTLDHALGVAWADACDALVRWKQGDPTAAVELMRGASEALEAIPMIPYAARIRRQLAGRLLEIGEIEAAVQELEHVHRTCVRLGAEPELDKTRLMFAEAHRPVPPKGTGQGIAGLTDRETEVAVLVARRMSNQEIGEALGMATRTASTHLSNIYKKLDIGSREALVDLVRASELA